MYIFTFLYVKMEESGGVRVTVHTIEGKWNNFRWKNIYLPTNEGFYYASTNHNRSHRLGNR